jgi:hypothetical protein
METVRLIAALVGMLIAFLALAIVAYAIGGQTVLDWFSNAGQ